MAFQGGCYIQSVSNLVDTGFRGQSADTLGVANCRCATYTMEGHLQWLSIGTCPLLISMFRNNFQLIELELGPKTCTPRQAQSDTDMKSSECRPRIMCLRLCLQPSRQVRGPVP